MDTFQHGISIIEKEMTKNPYFHAKWIRNTEHEQRHGSAHHKGQWLSANSVNDEAYHRADHRAFSRGNTAALVVIEQFL